MIQKQWQVFGTAVKGGTHQKLQDAIFWQEAENEIASTILAVADGHGSPKAFRSDRGAKTAVVTAVKELQRFLSFQGGPENLSFIKRSAYEDLPKRLAGIWLRCVQEDLNEHPLSQEELSFLEEKVGKTARLSVEHDHLIVYGSTLLVTVANDRFILSLQIGDGDIVWIDDNNNPYRPIPDDSRHFANETTSLCSRDAWKDFKVNFQIINGKGPALILCATDGYKNSFENDEGFLKVGQDIFDIIKTDGVDTVKKELSGWLSETSKKGSGDDITLGLLVRN